LHFGNDLKDFRQQTELHKQADFGEALGVARKTVSIWENKEFPPGTWEKYEDRCRERWPHLAEKVPRAERYEKAPVAPVEELPKPSQASSSSSGSQNPRRDSVRKGYRKIIQCKREPIRCGGHEFEAGVIYNVGDAWLRNWLTLPRFVESVEVMDEPTDAEIDAAVFFDYTGAARS